MSQVKMLPATALNRSAEYERQYFHVVVSNDTTAEEILTPGFWGHHAGTIKPGALLDVLRANFTLDMTIRAIGVGKGFVNMRELRMFEDGEAAAEITAARAEIDQANADSEQMQAETVPDDYKIGHAPRGANNGFFVVYKPTGDRIAEGLTLRTRAIAAALDHARKIAPPPAVPAPELEPAG